MFLISIFRRHIASVAFSITLLYTFWWTITFAQHSLAHCNEIKEKNERAHFVSCVIFVSLAMRCGCCHTGFRKNVCCKILCTLDARCACMTSNLKECHCSDCVPVIDFDISQTLAFFFDSRCFFRSHGFPPIRHISNRYAIPSALVRRYGAYKTFVWKLLEHRNDIGFGLPFLFLSSCARLRRVWKKLLSQRVAHVSLFLKRP